jgi:hypothetical protein
MLEVRRTRNSNLSDRLYRGEGLRLPDSAVRGERADGPPASDTMMESEAYLMGIVCHRVWAVNLSRSNLIVLGSTRVEWDSTLMLELRYAALHGMIVALVVARIRERNGGEDPGLADEAMCGCICGPCIPIEPREQRNRVSMWMRRVKRAIGQSCYL